MPIRTRQEVCASNRLVSITRLSEYLIRMRSSKQRLSKLIDESDWGKWLAELIGAIWSSNLMSFWRHPNAFMTFLDGGSHIYRLFTRISRHLPTWTSLRYIRSLAEMAGVVNITFLWLICWSFFLIFTIFISFSWEGERGRVNLLRGVARIRVLPIQRHITCLPFVFLSR